MNPNAKALLLSVGLVLSLGVLNGCKQNSAASPVGKGVITTVAGTGEKGAIKNGAPATGSPLPSPYALAVDAKGGLFGISQSQVVEVLPNGSLKVVAGNGNPGFSGDGGPATKAELKFPSGLAFDRDGNLFIADTINHRVRKVAPDGTISTVAGNGKRGFSGDGGPATKASLNLPFSVALDKNDNLYISDEGNHRVRVMSSAGILYTYAGTGKPGFSGDGGLAKTAQLNQPQGIAAGSDGSLYIADRKNQRIRKISANGIISTVAGTNGFAYAGDGGPATKASLFEPIGLTLDAQGNLFIADTFNQCIRKVDQSGTISTVIGKGSANSMKCCRDVPDIKDNGPATDAELDFPFAVAVDAQGNVYVADNKNDRIRKVAGIAGPGLLEGTPLTP
jgi:sugar lactone lactonase YvrE